MLSSRYFMLMEGWERSYMWSSNKNKERFPLIALKIRTFSPEQVLRTYITTKHVKVAWIKTCVFNSKSIQEVYLVVDSADV